MDGQMDGADGNGRSGSVGPPVRAAGGPKHRARWIVLAVAAVLLVAALDSAWVVWTARGQMLAAKTALERGATDLQGGRIPEAGAEFSAALSESKRATSALAQPGGVLLGVLPFVGDNVRAAKDLARASTLAAESGVELSTAAGLVGWSSAGIPRAANGSPKIPIAGLEAASPVLSKASANIAEASSIVSRIDTAHLLGSVRSAVDSARTTLAQRDRSVQAVGKLARLLPSFLGGDGPKHYMLLLMNLADPRGSGGFPGAYGILDASNGSVTLRSLAQVHILPVVHRVSAPPDVAARYGPFGALTHPIATTYSPDFPTSARLMLEMWAAGGKAPLDGVIAVDSVWMADILKATGPVTTPAWPSPLTADNISTVIDRDTFKTMSPHTADRTQNALGDALWKAVLTKPLPPVPLGRAVSEAARTRHLQVYSTDPTQEQLLAGLGVSGAVQMPSNPLLVSWDGATSNRTGYFAQTSVDYKAALSPDGSADVTITYTLHNAAPPGPPSILLGTGAPGTDPVGSFGAYVNVYLPVGASHIWSRVLGGPGLQLIQQEFGHPVAFQYLSTRSGGTAKAQVSFQLQNAVTWTPLGFRYVVDLLPQPALHPTHMSVQITLPEGTTETAVSPAMTVSGAQATYSADSTVATALWVSYRATSGLAPTPTPSS